MTVEYGLVGRTIRLRVGQQVRTEVERGRVLITPLRDEPLSLDQRLARFDPARHGGESMPTNTLGAEPW